MKKIELSEKELQHLKAALEEAAIERGYDITSPTGAYSLEDYEEFDPERADVYKKICEAIRGAVEAEVVGEI